jgi:hypothetical protein
MDDDSAFTLELSLFTFSMKIEVCGVFNSFLSFLKKNEETCFH